MVSGSFVDEALAQRFTDLLFEVDTTIGKAFVYLLAEHQSYNHRRMVLRMSGYMDRIWGRFDKQHPRGPLPPIIPLLICHAPEGWTAPRSFQELFDPTLFARAPELMRFVPSFELLVDDLSRTSDDDLASRGLANFAKLALWLLRDGRAGKVLAAMSRWAGLLDGLPRASLEAVLRYIAAVTANSVVIWEEFRANLHEMAPQVEGKVMTIIHPWEAKSVEKVLTKQLALKFGELSESVRSRLTSASPSEIEVWLERVLFATTLEQVFAETH